METDSFFYRLLKQFPQTLFDLLKLPPERVRSYRFDSVELKKSLRIDGLFQPRRPGLPLYVVEIQFQRAPAFYANLFAKAFGYLDENDPAQDWQAVAIFGSRALEPKELFPYRALLASDQVHRIYLDEYAMPAEPSLGLGILQLVTAPIDQAKALVAQLVEAERRQADSEQRRKMIELLEEVLIRRFTQLNREEVRAMFGLADIRKTRVWQEAHEEGIEEGVVKGIEKGRAEIVQKWLARGMKHQEIAALLEISVPEVRRLAKTSLD